MDPMSQLSWTSSEEQSQQSEQSEMCSMSSMANSSTREEKVRRMAIIDLIVVLMNSNDSNDDYIEEIESKCSEYCIEFLELSPIQFNYINIKPLFEALIKVDNWSAICISSKRCVDALEMAANYDNNYNAIDLWRKSKNRVFVVGIKSCEYLKARLGWEGIGSNCGNGDNLAKYMINDFRHELSAKPILFPCSQSRSDCLPQLLTNAGIVINEIVVYQTIPNIHLTSKFIQLNNFLIDCLEKRVLNEMKLIFVFFSPSGLRSVNPFLTKYIIKNEKIRHKLDLKYIAIGGTTGAALRESDLNVWFTSPKPNPKSLAQALSENLKYLFNTESKDSFAPKARELAKQKHEDSDE